MITAAGQDYLETLRRIAMELGPQRSFASALRFVLRAVAENHPFIRPHLVIFDPTARALRLCLADTASGGPGAQEVVYEPGVGITGQVFTLGCPVIVPRLCDNTVFQNRFFTRTAQEMQSLGFLSVPVLGRGEDMSEGLEVLGVLSADTPVAERDALQRRCHFLEVVAAMIGTQVSYVQQEMASSQPPHVYNTPHGAAGRVVTASKSMRQVVERAMQAGGSRGPVLLRGEAGTGKELLAEVVHQASPRRDMPLVHVHCAAVKADRWEAELLGVQKGALPSVLQTRKGLLEKAHLGTLFLQGLEYMPLALQAHLLRALLEHEVWRVGSSRPVTVDARMVWATQGDLEDLRGQGRLNEDLLAHFLVWDIRIPALRQRPEDILPLAELFLQQAAQAAGKSIERISSTAVELLRHYPWPGNAHELKHCMERAVEGCADGALRAWHLPPSLQGDGPDAEGAAQAGNFGEAVARFERELLKGALQKAHGNVLEASRLLEASYRVINYKVKKYGLDARRFARQAERHKG